MEIKGNFNTKEEADKYALKLKRKGFKTRVTHRPAYQEPIWNVWIKEENKKNK